GGVWDTQSTSVLSTLNAVDFLDGTTGVAVGDSGVILYTFNRGETWNTLTSITNSKLSDIKFYPPMTGIIVGEEGTILRSTTGGLDWTSVTFNPIYKWTSLQFIDKDTVIVVGDSAGLGRMAKSTDAGQTWYVPHIEPFVSFNSIYFVSPRIGYAAGRLGTVIATDDYGTTWRIRRPPLRVDYQSIYFVSDSLGWVVGKNGTIAKTKDGARTWEILASCTDRDLYDVQFNSSNIGWVVGNNGAILKTLDGGSRTIDITPVVPGVATSARLLPNFPNPYYPNIHNPGTYLPFELPEPAYVTIKIYDILGRKIQEIPLGYVSAGVYDNTRGNAYAPLWDGRDLNGNSVPSGVYVYSLVTPKFRHSAKLLLIR
ncbi:MAG: hypothetical protein HY800_07210, partial [Ignavibacteriales bacterium]|nr:hypothetical protein [Ignavibacteriales bacterium]